MRAIPIEPVIGRSKIGSRIRSARHSQQMTIEELARTTKLSKGFLSRVERDITSPSVTSLLAICDVLSINVGTLFEQSDAKLVKSGEGPMINLGGIHSDERLLTPRKESRVQVVRSEIAPAGHGGEQLYSINADIDVVHVIAGSIKVQFSDNYWILEEGDTLTFSGHEPHTWSVLGDKGATLLWVLCPAPWHG